MDRGRHIRIITRADHEYPKSLAHGQQTASVTRHRLHIQPISWGGRLPPHLGDRGQYSESLFELLCSPSACLGPFWRESSLTIVITVRFHSFLVCIYAHNTEHDQTTTGNVGDTVNAHQRVHLWSKRHESASYRDMSAATVHISASK